MDTPALPHSLFTEEANWRTEDGSELVREAGPNICHAPIIEDQERDSLWYSQHFIGKDHSNFIGIDENAGHFAVSMLREETRVRLILWLPSGVQVATLEVPLGETCQVTDAMKRLGWNYSKKKLKEMKKWETFEPGIPLFASNSSPSNPSNGASTAGGCVIGKWESELAKLEARMAQRFGTYKFGVLYVKDGQTTEEEMFSNRISSPAFQEFCTMLGDKIELREWPFFSGGLDTKSDRTGRLSIYTQHCGYEIMFHVSTMLPFTHSDVQQIDRKRHIGNDVVVIVFIDEDAKQSWSPNAIAARFPHIYAIVKPWTNPVDGSTSWLVNLASKDTVSLFGPPLPQPPLFSDASSFRLFLLSKLINGEREAIKSVPDFRQNNAHLSDLQDLYDRVSKDLKNSDTSSTGSTTSSKASKGGIIDESRDFPSSKSNDQSSKLVGLNTNTTTTTTNSSVVSFADASTNTSTTSTQPESDSIAVALGPSPRSPGGHLMGKSSPSLFGAHHHHSLSTALPSPSREPAFGGSFNLPPGASTRDVKQALHQSSANIRASSTTLSLSSTPTSTSLFLTPVGLTQDSIKRSIQSQLPFTMFASTETVQAFQNRPFYQNFPAEITCACDAWDGLTMVGTVDGLYVLDQNQYGSTRIYETKTVLHKGQSHRSNHYLQLMVIEELNILLAIIAKVGVVMYDLGSLLNFPQTSVAQEMLLPKTKDASLFSLGVYQEELAIASSTPRGIVIHRWQDDIFKLSQLIPVSQPLVMEFDARGLILAASESEFYWLKPDPENPTSNSIVTWSEKDKGMDPIAALLFENTGEYLLCFDSIGYFVNVGGQRTRNFEFRWFSRPVSIVSVYPYLLVFSKQHLEIRYLSNGSLCQFFEVDSKLESHLRFMSAFNGIQIATISHHNVGLTTSSSALGLSGVIKKDAQDLTSSSGSSTAPGTPTLPPASSAVRSPSPSSSSSNLREGSSQTGWPANQTSTIHILRLNTVSTCLVSNPQQLAQSTAGNPSFTIQGLQSLPIPQIATPQLSPTPPLSIPPNMQALSLNSARRNAAARKSGQLNATGASATNHGDFSAGSSPHSPASLLQQHYNANEGTASVDDSDDVFRGGAGSAASNHANEVILENGTITTTNSMAIPIHRRKSPGREAKSSMTIGSVGSSGSERSLPPFSSSSIVMDGGRDSRDSRGSTGLSGLMAGVNPNDGGHSNLRSGTVPLSLPVSTSSTQQPQQPQQYYPGGPGHLQSLRSKDIYKSTDDLSGIASYGGAGSKSSSPIARGRNSGENDSPSPTSRLSSSAKISRRKSLAFESDLNPTAGLRSRKRGAENSTAGTTPPAASNALIIPSSTSQHTSLNLTMVSSLPSPTSARSASASAINTIQLPHLQLHASLTAAHYQSFAKHHTASRKMELASQFDYDPSFEAQEDDFDDDEMMALPSPLPRSSLAAVRGGGARDRLVRDGEDDNSDDDDDEQDSEEDSSNTASPGTARSVRSTDSPNHNASRPSRKKGRTASDKLSGSSERSPRTSPATGSGRFRSSDGASADSPATTTKKSKKMRQGSGSSSSSGAPQQRHHVRSGSDLSNALVAPRNLGELPSKTGSSTAAGGDPFTLGFGAALKQPPSPSLAALSLASSSGDALLDNTSSGSGKQRMMNKRNRKSLGGALNAADLLAEGIVVDHQHLQRGLSPGRAESPSGGREKTSPSRRSSSARKVPSRASSQVASEVSTPTSDSSLPELMSNLAKFTLEGRSSSPAKSPKTRKSEGGSKLSKSAVIDGESSGSAPVSPIGTPTKKRAQKTPDKLRVVTASEATTNMALLAKHPSLETAITGAGEEGIVSFSPRPFTTSTNANIDAEASNNPSNVDSSDSPATPRSKSGLAASASQGMLSPRSSSKKGSGDRRKSEKKLPDSPSLNRKKESGASPSSTPPS